MTPSPAGRLVSTAESNGVTEMRFTHHLDGKTSIADVGPGWEYFLGGLVASRLDSAMPVWNDYYPAQKAYYRELASQQS